MRQAFAMATKLLDSVPVFIVSAITARMESHVIFGSVGIGCFGERVVGFVMAVFTLSSYELVVVPCIVFWHKPYRRDIEVSTSCGLKNVRRSVELILSNCQKFHE